MDKVATKKEQLLDAAEKLFSVNGYDGASTRAIAKEANVNMAMLNYYFGGKQGLLEAVVLRRTDNTFQFLQELNANEILTSLEKIDLCIDKFVQKFFATYCFNRLVNRQIMLRRDEMANVVSFVNTNFHRNLKEMKKMIQSGQTKGEIKEDVDVDSFLLNIMASLGMVINNPELVSLMLEERYKDEVEFYSNAKIKERFSLYLKSVTRQMLKKQEIEKII